MRVKTLVKSSVLGSVAALLLLGIGVASAQAPNSGSSAAPDTGIRQVVLSPADQVQKAGEYLNRMGQTRDLIQRDLEDARRQNDVVKTLCLDDKLNQIDVAITNAESRSKSLGTAAERSDNDLAHHEFTILSVLHERANQLDAEAKQCIGKEVGFVGESSTSMTIDEVLPLEDPSEFPDWPIIAQLPNCASCYK